MSNSFGEALRSYRKPITQVQLSQASGISRTTLAMYETGKRFPDPEQVSHITRHLNAESAKMLKLAWIESFRDYPERERKRILNKYELQEPLSDSQLLRLL